MSTENLLIAGQTDLAANVVANSALDVESTDRDDHSRSGSESASLPRPKRRSRRAKADRGLPPDEELAKLAKAYLQRQTKRWPQLASAGLLPSSTDEAIGQMVEDFKERHRTGKIDPVIVQAFRGACKKLGGSYNRFSCDNSSPNSVLDQMVNTLDKAAAEGRFIPWRYVFADYSVTGLDASRQGYTSYKAILADKDHGIETTYIDDFTRASRDEIEWWKLAALSKKLNKRMIGASDGFDLHSTDWEMKISIYGLLSRLFIKSLREKVKRGMAGAARRGTCLGKLPLGFARRVHHDENGRATLGPDGLPIYEICIDPATSGHRLLMYELYAEQKWSPQKIARHFNKLRVDGWDGWTRSAIIKLLWSSTAIGIFIWNRTRREYDWDSEKVVLSENPRSEWQVHYNRDLAIVPLALWRAARRRLAEARRKSPITGRKPSRNQSSATTLFSGTLFCEYCSEELKLIRSTPKYKQLGCLNGATGAHDCKLSASKSTRIVEECLLKYLWEAILTEPRIEKLVAQANAHLEKEAQKPHVDLAPLKAKKRRKEAAIDKFLLLIEETNDKSQCKAYDKRVLQLQSEVNKIDEEIRDANVRNRKQSKPLTLAKVKKYLAEFRKTLSEETPRAADAIRALTGPIKIKQEELPGRSRSRWIATFSPDLVGLLRYAAGDESRADYSDIAGYLELQSVEVPLEKIPLYEQFAEKFKAQEANGASIQSIASAHRISWKYAQEILHFAKTGERPAWKAGNRTGEGGTPAKSIEIAKEVVRLRDVKKMPFKQIAAKLNVGQATVRRAYDLAKPEAVCQAAETGKRPRRGRYSNLGLDVLRRIRKMLANDVKVSEIAAKLGCGTSTVYRIRKEMQAEADGGQAA